METILHIDKKDNLGTCLKELKKGEKVQVDDVEITVNENIPIFHKLALADIQKGDLCYKYGQIIGQASVDIKKGDYVHVHNCESTRGRGDKK